MEFQRLYVTRLRRLWDEHIHKPFPSGGDDPHAQEIALYASWLGGIVEVALASGTLDPQHADMLDVRRAEGNQGLFRAAAELGEPYRSYLARLLKIEDALSEMTRRSE
jgi:hypothetical protein